MIRCFGTTLLLGSLLQAVACSSPDPAPGPGGGGATGADDCDGRAAPVAAGLSRESSEGYRFELVTLAPESPVQTSTSPGNRWVIHVTDGDGAPVTGATLNLTTFMPDHDHPGPPAAAFEEADGDYAIDELFFPMPGLYTVTLSLAPPKGERQSVSLSMCLGVASG